ncbi:hypothetical protein [Massilia sp. Leaf139]|uniref:hypothetical protein n=1 Tax=Massilia sp. Leaf139 TaxID=1736272 RepID=UPI0006F6CBC9|nr:hypothetical protein [Massilia sp. Leaf139]KQQ89280.1 hypothetical protein ASF77_11610 [Massilia sp. Leaf139]
MPVYVQHETLNRVSDVFNAEALWQAPGLALLNRRPYLRDLLERAPREQRGRAATRCFSHVTLVLPQEEVDDDRHLTRGARVRDLAQSLQALHQKDFGDLLGAEDVRYHVLGSEKLEPGQVEVKFGHAVYLPAPNEQVLHTVSVSRDSAIWQPVCPIYPNGRLTVLGVDAARATHAVPGWPFAQDANILLINDGPDTPVEVQVRPKDAFECAFDAASGYYTIRARAVDATGTQPRLLLKIVSSGAPAAAMPRPVSAAPAPRAPAVWKARARSLDDAELTAVPVLHRAGPAVDAAAAPDATYAPVMRQRVSLAALALPRLSRYRDTGAAALEFGIGPDLAVGPPAPDCLLGFALDAQDGILAVTADGRQRIAVPNRFAPRDGVEVRVLAPAALMAERYSAIVCLPQAPGLPVIGGTRHVFGRAASMLAGLRVLDGAACLRNADGATSGADRLGLSRNAFGFEAGPDGYRVTRASATQALYHLDEGFAFVAAIEAMEGEAPYVVPLGHHIVAGHYVLRVEA